ncbi:lipoprotein LpqH [Mycobacterium sp. Z3061]|uniref:lipoprotein LpqH n=1 Tax=Mycobacterium sp. Z3061 TaxID=3073562 RepID=UPI0028739237|nr:lipoprotein LpqH [Mycobacterium sp. Z3061]
MPSTSRHHAGPVAAALAGAVALSASLTGCNHTSFSPTVRGPTVTYTGGAIAATNDAKVVVDGQEHRVDGQIACIALDGGETMISIGKEPIAVKITLTVNRESPRVRMVILQNLVGYTLFVMDPPQKGEASASKDGKRYTIGGTSWGLDTHNDDVKKPFRIQFTCP